MIDPGKNELIIYRLNRAKETLEEAAFQTEHKKWNTAVNRMYYACYYAVTALLLYKSINAKSHSGTIQMFGLHFIKPGLISEEDGDLYTDLFEMRHTGDYDDFIVFEEEQVVSLVGPAQKLIEHISQLINL